MVFILVLSVFSLCSCDFIEEKRAEQAVYVETEDGLAIEYLSKKYKPISIPYELTVNANEFLYVTEKDVPLLLSTFLGTGMYCNKDKTVISSTDSNIYCREDVYEEYSERLKNSAFNDMCIQIYSFNEETYEYDMKYEKLDDNVVTAINAIISGVAPTTEMPYTEQSVEVFKCDEDAVFMRSYLYAEMDFQGRCYLHNYIGGEYGYYYAVPNRYEAEITAIINKSLGEDEEEF